MNRCTKSTMSECHWVLLWHRDTPVRCGTHRSDTISVCRKNWENTIYVIYPFFVPDADTMEYMIGGVCVRFYPLSLSISHPLSIYLSTVGYSSGSQVSLDAAASNRSTFCVGVLFSHSGKSKINKRLREKGAPSRERETRTNTEISFMAGLMRNCVLDRNESIGKNK